MKNILILFVACMLLTSVTGLAQVPQNISYQGLLTTSSGTPVQDGAYDLKFDIYNLPTMGTLRHTETHSAVPVERGTFSLVLGPLPAIFSESLYVEVTAVAGPGISTPMTFAPRSELTSAPYALHAQYADTADYARNVPPSQWITNGSNIYYNSGNVGIGVTNPSQLLEVKSGAASTQAQVINTSSTGAAALSMVGDGTNLVELTQYGLAYPGTWGPSGVANAGLSALSAYTGSTGLMIGIRANAPIYFANNNTSPRMTILGDGNVGIGTTNPIEKLTVGGTGDTRIQIESNGGAQLTSVASALGGYVFTRTNHPLNFSTNNAAPQMTVTTSGKVGIGTTTPDVDAKLDVNGYAFAKAPVVVYDDPGGIGTSFNITWSINTRVDNNIVEMQPNFYHFRLKKAGWYRVSYHIIFTDLISTSTYLVSLWKNGSFFKYSNMIMTSQNFEDACGSVVVSSDGDDVISLFGSSNPNDTFTIHPDMAYMQLSIEYLGAE